MRKFIYYTSPFIMIPSVLLIGGFFDKNLMSSQKRQPTSFLRFGRNFAQSGVFVYSITYKKLYVIVFFPNNKIDLPQWL